MVNDWKEFLDNNVKCYLCGYKIKDACKGDSHKLYFDTIEKLQEYFLGEVKRITKELKPFKGKINFDRDYWIHLNGQLSVYKELAGVETKK